MKLHILTDLHIEFGPFYPPETDADLVILAGDTDVGTKGITWAKEAFVGKQVVYIPGNHEYYGEVCLDLLGKMQSLAVGSNVRLLDCNKYEQNGVVFLGATLWTDFKLFGDQQIAMLNAQKGISDFQRIRISSGFPLLTLTPRLVAEWHSQANTWLKKELREAAGKKIVVVTHYLPSMKSVADQWKNDLLSAAFASSLDKLVAESGAVLWIHGHTHTACDYTLGETRVICNPRGYSGREDTGYDPALVVEI
jgi:Icc-related predicted phosphoesterase